MPTFIGVSETPYTHEDGVVCLGDVVDLSDDQAAPGLASGQIVASAVAPPVVAAPEPEPAPETSVPEPQNEEV